MIERRILNKKLELHQWDNKIALYNAVFSEYKDISKVSFPTISIIVISWRLHSDTLKNFQTLMNQRDQNFELIFVNNGNSVEEFKCLEKYINKYIQLNDNTGAYLARNIGALFSDSDLLMFLEDDGIPSENLIRGHINIHKHYDIIGCRGKYIPKTKNIPNKIQWHYDLGENPIPFYLNLEGNCSIKRKEFFEIGGWDDEIRYGYGGADLSYRLKNKFPESEPTWYFPSIEISHDYSDDIDKMNKKIDLQENSRERLEIKNPNFSGFMNSYREIYYAIESNFELRKEVKKLLNLNQKIIFEKKINQFNWGNKLNKYLEYFDHFKYYNYKKDPDISVIVISWRLHPDTIKNFQILSLQKDQNFELIFVNNGADETEFKSLEPFVDKYIKLNKNTGAYLARNIGALFSESPILFFLEDDGLPDPEIVKSHINLHNKYDIVAARGVYLPKTESEFNEFATHYYLGDGDFPIYADLEGNTSYKAEAFFKVGGWDDEINFGGGGIDLSIRLAEIEPDLRKQIYSPDPKILHDYCKDIEHFEEKRRKQKLSHNRLKEKHTEWDAYLNSFKIFSLDSDSIPRKNKREESSMDYKKCNISVCIITYNRADFISEAINSVVNQYKSGLEIVIVDDGSSDNTEEIVRRFDLPYLKYIIKEHTNAPDTRNRAIAEAGNDFILWLDSDDLLTENAIDTYSKYLTEYKNVDIFYPNLKAVDIEGRLLHDFTYPDYYQQEDKMIEFLITGQPIPNPGALISKKVFKETGGYNIEFNRAHDFEFYTRVILRKKYKVKHIPEVLCNYRIHDKNITFNKSGIVDFSYEVRIFNKILATTKIENLFPLLDWENNRTEASSIAKVKIAQRYYELDADDYTIKYFSDVIKGKNFKNDFLALLHKFIDDKKYDLTLKFIDHHQNKLTEDIIREVSDLVAQINEND